MAVSGRLAIGGLAVVATFAIVGVTMWQGSISPASSASSSGSGSSAPSSEGSVTLQKIDHPDLLRRVNFRALGDDGRSATCTPLGRMAVAICDLTTGSVRVLRMPKSSVERSPGARLSPDGTQVASRLD